MKKFNLFFMASLVSVSLCTFHVSAMLSDEDTIDHSPSNTVKEKWKFSENCKIKYLSADKISIKEGGEKLEFDETNKPAFTNTHGETVVEYSGVATDKNPTRSWAKATFQPKGFSDAHHHNERTEDYYITGAEKGMARIRVDDALYDLSVGDHIRIKPGVVHQVMNLSDSTPLELFVKCYPSWIFHDVHLEKSE